MFITNPVDTNWLSKTTQQAKLLQTFGWSHTHKLSNKYNICFVNSRSELEKKLDTKDKNSKNKAEDTKKATNDIIKKRFTAIFLSFHGRCL